MIGRRKRVHATFEIAFLMIPARSPAQAAPDVQVLAENVAHHVLGRDALRRAFIMSAAGGMDVMVARPPAALGRVYPALEGERFGVRGCPWNSDLFLQHQVFRPARIAHRVLARLEQNGLAVAAVYLRVEEKVWSETARSRWIHSALHVPNVEGRHDRPAIAIAYPVV